MEKLQRNIWLFPCCVFLFLSIVLTVKFIFIFFFGTAYEPEFIFELTPLYLLSGLNKVQLLLLSLLTIVLDMVLHLRSSRKRLLLSFIPTSLMLSSIGFSIMFRPMDLSSVLHYFLFICLLFVVLFDYQCILKRIPLPTMTWKPMPAVPIMSQKQSAPVHNKSLRLRQSIHKHSAQAPVVSSPSFDFKNSADNLLQRMQTIVDELERKTTRIETVKQEFIKRQNAIEHQEKTIADRVISYMVSREKPSFHEDHLVRTIPSDDALLLKEKIKNHLIVDETSEIVAVVQRGIFKQISNTFAHFLGYEQDELLQKSFFVFVAPQGFAEAKKYYLNRLKGVTTNSFRTVLLTKDHTEVFVDITITPTIYKGAIAEFLSVKTV